MISARLDSSCVKIISSESLGVVIGFGFILLIRTAQPTANTIQAATATRDTGRGNRIGCAGESSVDLELFWVIGWIASAVICLDKWGDAGTSGLS